MLAAAGVAFTVEAADVDEPAIRKTLLAAKSAATPPQHRGGARARQGRGRERAAPGLARHRRRPGAGAGRRSCLTKPKDEAAARAHLAASCGARRTICTRPSRSPWMATCPVDARRHRDGSTCAISRMRFSRTISRAPATASASIGRRLRARGPRHPAVRRIEGDYFTILGLPLLPLLAELRARGMIAA